MDTKDAYIEHLENTISSLQKQVDNLTEMIILLRKEKFGSSSEKTPAKRIDGQLSLLNEAEVEAASKPEEPIVQKVDGYYHKPFRTKRAELIKIFLFVRFHVISHVISQMKICTVISVVLL